MAFESLSERLSGVFKRLRGKGKLTEADIKAAMREVRTALLEADVNYKVAKDFIAGVTERAMGQEVMESLTPAQQVIKIVNESLTELMGGNEAARIHIKSKPPTVLMLCGLQGNGKTTHAAKLATAPRPLISCRWWASRRVFRCSPWAPKSPRSSPRRPSPTPRITATTS